MVVMQPPKILQDILWQLSQYVKQAFIYPIWTKNAKLVLWESCNTYSQGTYKAYCLEVGFPLILARFVETEYFWRTSRNEIRRNWHFLTDIKNVQTNLAEIRLTVPLIPIHGSLTASAVTYTMLINHEHKEIYFVSHSITYICFTFKLIYTNATSLKFDLFSHSDRRTLLVWKNAPWWSTCLQNGLC